MKPQRQTIEDPKTGNCLATCIACILDLDVEDVPNFVGSNPAKWWETQNQWLISRGWIPYYVPASYETVVEHCWSRFSYAIAVGRSSEKDEDLYHAVVYKDGESYWDPGSSASFLFTLRYFIFLIPAGPHVRPITDPSSVGEVKRTILNLKAFMIVLDYWLAKNLIRLNRWLASLSAKLWYSVPWVKPPVERKSDINPSAPEGCE